MLENISSVVLDTNILVSALWSENGNAAKIIKMMLDGEIINYYSDEIMEEYKDVLFRDKFKDRFSYDTIEKLLGYIEKLGKNITVNKSDIWFEDEDDRIFYDAARESKSMLITGNTAHFPDESFIIKAADYLKILEEENT